MKRRWLLGVCCLLAPCMVLAAKVEATLDRTDVHLGETVTLNLHVDDAVSVNMPDLSVLQRDFDVLDTSTNSSFSLINGRQGAELNIGIALRPKHQGDVEIPPLIVAGSQTHPLSLHVGAADNSALANAGKDVYVEAVANSPRAYVGQQLLYTVRLFYSGELGEGSLPQPQVEGATFRQLKDSHYEAMRDGRRYHVVERRYALTPQHAGTLVIPSITFQGNLIDRRHPNGPDDFFNPGGLFGNVVPVTADSPPVKIAVQAPPADWGKTSWLPARSLTLSLKGLPSDDKVTVGQPLNLRLSVDVQGLPGEALPPLSLPAIDGAAVYPDPSSTTTQDDNGWLSGHSERGFAIFPQRAGTLRLPEITLTWFDVKSGQKRLATIPSHRLTVLAASDAQAAGVANPKPGEAVSSAMPSQAPSATYPQSAAPASAALSPWRWLAFGSIALWLLSVAVFVWFYRRQRSPRLAPTTLQGRKKEDATQGLRQAFLEAARGHDRSAQARCLLAWARAERPDLRNLERVAEALASPEQRAAIELLEREQYAGVAAKRSLDLVAVFADGLAWRTQAKAAADSPLPPLYPFKLE